MEPRPERLDVSGLPLLYDEEEDDETRLAPRSSGTPSQGGAQARQLGPSSELPVLYPDEDGSETKVAAPRGTPLEERVSREVAPSEAGMHTSNVPSDSLPRMYSGEDDDETLLVPSRSRTPSHPSIPKREESSAGSEPRKAGTVVVGSQDDVQAKAEHEVTPTPATPAIWHTPPEEPPPQSLRQRTETALRALRQSRLALYLLVGIAVIAVAVSMVVGIAVLTDNVGGSSDDDWIIEK